MVVQTTGYVNFNKFFEWVLVNFSMLFQIVAIMFMDFHFSFFRALSVFQAGRKYRFFQWHDDEICEHGKVLIPQQRQMIIKLKAELTDCKKREKFLVVIVALLVAIFAILCLLR